MPLLPRRNEGRKAATPGTGGFRKRLGGNDRVKSKRSGNKLGLLKSTKPTIRDSKKKPSGRGPKTMGSRSNNGRVPLMTRIKQSLGMGGAPRRQQRGRLLKSLKH
ncbi:hypothetical protein ACG7TL_003661 [Trametes sanguinea]